MAEFTSLYSKRLKNYTTLCNISSYCLFGIHSLMLLLPLQVDGNCYNLVQLLLVGKFSNQTTIFGPVIPDVTDTGRVEVILANITTNEVFYVTLISKSMERIPETSAEMIISKSNHECDLYLKATFFINVM